MTPHAITPDWAVSLMNRITKYDDPDVLEAAIELLAGTFDERGERGDAAAAALEFGYRKTADCDRACREYLSIAS